MDFDSIKLNSLMYIFKDYYIGTDIYKKEDIELLKKYVIGITFENLEKYKELIKIMTNDIGNFLTLEEIDLLLKKNTDVEINAMLLKYSNKINATGSNPNDYLNLDDNLYIVNKMDNEITDEELANAENYILIDYISRRNLSEEEIDLLKYYIKCDVAKYKKLIIYILYYINDFFTDEYINDLFDNCLDVELRATILNFNILKTDYFKYR